ncbi:MAG TPA: hypothetical protein VFQ53_39375 [Kofleriaceae bacterium]|nr:hypothetical protein [Kofleriaceae bacterium]
MAVTRCHVRSLATIAMLVAACGNAAPTPVRRATAPTTTARVERGRTPERTASLGRAGTRTRVIEAPHGAAIVAIALAPDGKAAITTDERGGARLWPTLDGRVEPRLVDLPAATALALARDPNGFVVAAVDASGGLALDVIDRDGLTRSHISIAGDPGFLGVASTERGVIAWRADQTLVRYAPDGTIASQLAVEPGQRIVAISTAGSRGLAVVERANGRRARWIEVGERLAWGAWIDTPDRIGSVVTLSPSGKRFAHVVGTQRGVTSIATIDTATAKVVHVDTLGMPTAIGLVDDDHLAAIVNDALTWIDLRAVPSPAVPDDGSSDRDPVFAPAMLAIGGGHAVTATTGELVLGTPVQTDYLGYGSPMVTATTAASGGRLLVGLGASATLLDAKLQPVSGELRGSPLDTIMGVAWLSDDAWLVETVRNVDAKTSVSLYDARARTQRPVRDNLATIYTLHHEPSTHLVTLARGDHPEVLRHAPGTTKLEPVASMSPKFGRENVVWVPVAPQLANGTQVVMVRQSEQLLARWLRDPRGDHGPAITVDGSLAGIDRAGHVFVWQNDAKGTLELAIYLDGHRVGTLPNDGPLAVAADHEGKRIAQVGDRGVSVMTLDGSRVWSQPLQGFAEASWLDDDALALVSATGIARVDAKTGALQSARCGWHFGLSPTPHPAAPAIEPICTQLR